MGAQPTWRLHIGSGCALLASAGWKVGRHNPGPRASRNKEITIPAKLFVGNLNFQTTKERLQEFLAPAGNIVDVALPTDRETGRPRGFAFVEFASDAEASAAIERFNGQELDGRALRLDSAEDRPRRTGGFNAPRGMPDGGGGGDPFFDGRRPFKSKGSRRGLRARKRGG